MICPVCGHNETDSARSVQQNKLRWGMLRLVSDHALLPCFQGKFGPKNLNMTIKESLGYVEPLYDHLGNVIKYVPISTEFHKMGQSEFNEVFDKMQAFIFEKILPNVGQESFERELCQMLRVPTMGDYL